MTRLQRRVWAIVLAILGLGGFAAVGADMATAGTSACPAGLTCITGKLTIRDPGSDTPNQLLVLDKHGAPMLWTNYGGTGSGGEPVCVFSLRLQPLACIGGPWGNYGGRAAVTLYLGGRPVTLTARDLLVLTRWAHAREARR